MGRFKKEVKSFGKEFSNQIFGKSPKPRSRQPRQKPGAYKQYQKAQRWAQRNGLK